jgi:hypothetical protein
MSTHRSSLLVLILVLAPALGAADTELGLSLGAGNPAKDNLNLANGTLITGTGTAINTQFSGPWKLAGFDLAQELARGERVRFWVRVGYTTGLGSPAYVKDGQDSPAVDAYTSEVVNGTLTTSAFTCGLGLSWVTNKLGEYGLDVARRTNRTKVSGTLTTLSFPEGPGGTSGYSLSDTDSDWQVTLSMTFVQAHPTFKTFERLSYAFALGGASGDVAADHQGYLMGGAYLARTVPGQELRFGFGFRL